VDRSGELLEWADILGGLYDAAADPSQWDRFLQQLAHSTGATSAALVMRDAGRDVCTLSHSWELDSEFLRLYQEHNDSVDIWGQRGLSKPAGYVCTSPELCPLPDLAMRTEAKRGRLFSRATNIPCSTPERIIKSFLDCFCFFDICVPSKEFANIRVERDLLGILEEGV
jgi:hypothetical protein